MVQLDPYMIVANVETADQLDVTAENLLFALEQRNVANGVIVVSQDIALKKFGSILAEHWLDQGISVFRSPVPNLLSGQCVFVDEYRRIQSALAPQSGGGSGGTGPKVTTGDKRVDPTLVEGGVRPNEKFPQPGPFHTPGRT